MTKVAFIGGGSFGTALATTLAKKGYDINIWDRNKNTVEDINIKKENIRYLHGVVIPSNVKASTDIEQVLLDSEYIFLAVPSHVIREICHNFKNTIKFNQIIISIAKGIEEESKLRLSQVIKQELPNNPVVIVSGPSHAEEVGTELPTTLVVTSDDMKYAYRVQEIMMTNKLRIYTNDDIIGIEIGGAVKNIIALAAGVSDGIGFGDNTKAALMTRGMSEIVRVGLALGGKKDTFYGLTGMGDLIVTCTSMHSRNRRAGILIGQGIPCEQACKEIGMVVEGVKACSAFHKLKEELGVEMPITDTLYKILFENKDPKYAVYELMTRDKKDEV